MDSLTHRQKECFDFVAAYIKRTGGVAPASQEIERALRTGHSNAWRLVNQCVERGWLTKKTGLQRTLAVNVDARHDPSEIAAVQVNEILGDTGSPA